MKHRHWLLVAAGVALFYTFVFLRLHFIGFYANYGEHDIDAGVALTIAFLGAWVALESVHFIWGGRGGACACGYSLRGVKCPECGRDQGEGRGG
jgi:hypothetical protein